MIQNQIYCIAAVNSATFLIEFFLIKSVQKMSIAVLAPSLSHQ